MSNSALYTRMTWETTDEGREISRILEELNFFRRVCRVDKCDETFFVKTKLGEFEVIYHSFEKVFEIFNKERTFRIVSGKSFYRFDGDKRALKRWLMLLKLSS